ncbi:hypothetical protein OH76DRAFT_1400752 [Lentinus brumalis]|uniref:Uncharacterized protein n=1 Tax=Lentinus brumalis TaxID=2498619 RepID=A0A371DH43_9APHY|nr:hypothetical protein OH76DRAFT_1400752 [Polyporus brumalis]
MRSPSTSQLPQKSATSGSDVFRHFQMLFRQLQTRQKFRLQIISAHHENIAGRSFDGKTMHANPS